MQMLNYQNCLRWLVFYIQGCMLLKIIMPWRLDYLKENVMLKVDRDSQNRHRQRLVNEN